MVLDFFRKWSSSKNWLLKLFDQVRWIFCLLCCGWWRLVVCLSSQQCASVSQGQICSDNCTCCHTETEVADQTCYLTQSQYTDTRPTCPCDDLITPGTWQGSPLECHFFRGREREGVGEGGGQVEQIVEHQTLWCMGTLTLTPKEANNVKITFFQGNLPSTLFPVCTEVQKLLGRSHITVSFVQ